MMKRIKPTKLKRLLIIARILLLRKKCHPLGNLIMTTKLLLISSRTRTRSRTMKGKLSLPRSQSPQRKKIINQSRALKKRSKRPNKKRKPTKKMIKRQPRKRPSKKRMRKRKRSQLKKRLRQRIKSQLKRRHKKTRKRKLRKRHRNKRKLNKLQGMNLSIMRMELVSKLKSVNQMTLLSMNQSLKNSKLSRTQ